MCQQSLEVGLLGLAELLGDAVAFVESGMLSSASTTSNSRSLWLKRIRSYKQTNYNLLREQSEGYSKLITEVVASIAPP